MIAEPWSLSNGMVVIHRGGTVCVLKERKADNSGWWMQEGGGLDDRVARTEDWMVLTRELVRSLFATAVSS